MERFTQMKLLQKRAKYLEITLWICNNDLSAFLRVLCGKTCPSEVFQHRLYDWIGLFNFVLCHLEDKYRTGDCICQGHFRILVRNVCLYFMVIMEIDVKNYLCVEFYCTLVVLILYICITYTPTNN